MTDPTTAQGTTDSAEPPHEPWDGFFVATPGDGEVTLYWGTTKNPEAALLVEIYRTDLSNYKDVKYLGSTTRATGSYLVGDLKNDQAYEFEFHPRDKYGRSMAIKTVKAEPKKRPEWRGLLAVTAGRESATISWSTEQGDPKAERIELFRISASPAISVAVIDKMVGQVTVGELSGERSYAFQAWKVSPDGDKEYPRSSQVVTCPSPPLPPVPDVVVHEFQGDFTRGDTSWAVPGGSFAITPNKLKVSSPTREQIWVVTDKKGRDIMFSRTPITKVRSKARWVHATLVDGGMGVLTTAKGPYRIEQRDVDDS